MIEEVETLIKRLGRNRAVAMTPASDPFLATSPSRLRAAEWCAGLWARHRLGRGVHLRRIHYVLLSVGAEMIDGSPYENTEQCQNKLGDALRDARYLSLVDANAVVDQRNPDVYGSLDKAEEASFRTSGGGDFPRIWKLSKGVDPSCPSIELRDEPAVAQRYHVEIWTEKSTQDDILRPLASRHHCMLFGGQGEVSLTRCTELIARATGRPIRILYISDFDPAGRSIPLTAARKFEFELRTKGLGIDLQVNQVALTLEQCEAFNLPRTPIKPGEKRKDEFEERWGRGATELDALEALHPGSLARIVETEIKRYFDEGLERKVREKISNYQSKLAGINEEVKFKHLDLGGPILLPCNRFDWLTARYDVMVDEANAIIDHANVAIRTLNLEVHEVQREMDEELAALPKPEWELPEPKDGNEWQAPLMDSTRDYEEQLNAYKVYQDRPQTTVSQKTLDAEQKKLEAELETAFGFQRSGGESITRRFG